MHHVSDQLLKAEHLVLLDQTHSYVRKKAKKTHRNFSTLYSDVLKHITLTVFIFKKHFNAGAPLSPITYSTNDSLKGLKLPAAGETC